MKHLEIPVNFLSGIANFVNFDKDNKMNVTVTGQPIEPFNTICDDVAKKLFETREPLIPENTTYYTVEISGRQHNRMYKRKCDASNSLTHLIYSRVLGVLSSHGIHYGYGTNYPCMIKNKLLKRGVLVIYKHFSHAGCAYKVPEIY